MKLKSRIFFLLNIELWIYYVYSQSSNNAADPIDFTVVHDSTIYNASSSVDGLPDEVSIDFEVLGKPVSLNLKRNQKMKNANTVSVIRMSASGIPTVVQQVLQDHEIFGEYHDLNKKAIFTWSCEKIEPANETQKCRPTLEGTFQSGVDNLHMQVMDKSALSKVASSTSANIQKLWSRVKDIVTSATSPTQVYGIYRMDSSPVTATDFKEAQPMITGQTAAFGREARLIRENVLPGGQMYNLEVLAIIDYSIYERFYKASELGTEREKDNEAKHNIKKYFSHVFNGVDMLYQNIDNPQFGLSVGLSGFIIADSPDVSPWTTPHADFRSGGRDELLVSTPLNELIRWSFRARNIPENDHIMLLTDYDLYSMDGGIIDKRTAGYARVGSVCSLDSVSVIEDHGGFQSINAAAHELGHSLGARHDGSGNRCNPRAQYVMTAHGGFESEANKRNPWQFSDCSVDYFKRYVATLPNNHCLTDPVDIFDEAAFRNYVSNYPGQEMTPNEQCQDILGLDSFYGWGTELGSFSDICNEMSCAVPGSTRSYRVYKAATGTSCGDKRWCIEGQCVFDHRAPSKSPSCVFGDTQRRFSMSKSCRQYMLEQPMRCYDKFYRDRCCDTCEKLDTGVTGCEYGDKFLNCNPRNCRDRNYARDCCSTCGLAPRPVISQMPGPTLRPRPVTAPPRPVNRPTRPPFVTRRPPPSTTRRPASPPTEPTANTPLEPSGGSGMCLRKDSRFLLVFRCSSLPNLFGQPACDNPLISRFCCERCPAPACEDKPTCGVRYARQCYVQKNRDECCRTCKKFQTGSKDCEYGDRIRSCERYVGELGPALVCSRYKKYCCGLCDAMSPTAAPMVSKNGFESSPSVVKENVNNAQNVMMRDPTDGNLIIVGTGKSKRKGNGKAKNKQDNDKGVKGGKKKNSDKKNEAKNIDSTMNSKNGEKPLEKHNSDPVEQIIRPVNGGIIIRGLPMQMPRFVISRRPIGGWSSIRRFRPGRRRDAIGQLQLAIAGK